MAGKTAILKFAMPYTSSDPTFELSVERLVYEARALRDIPWKEFKYPTSVVGDLLRGSQCSLVAMLEVCFDDSERNVVVMQDMVDGEPD